MTANSVTNSATHSEPGNAATGAASGAAILDLKARKVWDSRGRATVEADLLLAGGAWGRGIAPSGASTGAGEARVLDADTAVANLRGEIRDAVLKHQPADQQALDQLLIALDGRPDKSRLGGNALVALSLAHAHARAAEAGVPLWRHLAGERHVTMPVPQIQIFGGGAHARGSADIQDFMVICNGAGSFTEAMDMTAEVYHAAGARLAKRGMRQGVADEGGFWPSFKANEDGLVALVQAIEDAGMKPGADVSIALDIAATQLWNNGRYVLGMERRELTPEQWMRMLLRWVEIYPVVSIEDPFEENDAKSMAAFTAEVAGMVLQESGGRAGVAERARSAGRRVQIVGDDFFCTDPVRIRRAIAQKACNTVLIKPNQIGTLTEAHAAWEAAREGGYGAIVSARSGETEDVSIVHLAIGWGVPQLKVGSFTRSERMAKWNEGIRIEESLGRKAGVYPAKKLFKT